MSKYIPDIRWANVQMTWGTNKLDGKSAMFGHSANVLVWLVRIARYLA